MKSLLDVFRKFEFVSRLCAHSCSVSFSTVAHTHTQAPGLFATPLLEGLPPAVQEELGASVPCPNRLGRPSEYGQLVVHILENHMLNGTTIRLDGALRMPP